MINILGHIVIVCLGNSAESLVRALPGKLFSAVVNPIARNIPNYQVNSPSQFVSTTFIILLGAFILYLVLEVFFSIYRNTSFEQARSDHAPDKDIEEKPGFSVSIAIDSPPDNSFRHTLGGKILFCCLCLAFIGLHAGYFRSVAIFSFGSETMKKIEVIAPYVSDLEYKQMKADFYLIEDWDDYDQLDKKLNTIMEAEGISVTNK